jgi:glycosyltransferase involved in cell wall biosynthesis
MYISVVVATYNRRELLEKCIRSLFEQSYSKDDYEIIIVDDGSTDNTQALVNELKSLSPSPLKYIKQDNGGPSSARNKGVKNATGQIIAFIDSDAIADSKWLESIANSFKNNDVAGVGGRIIPYGTVETPFSTLIEIKDNFSASSNIAYKKCDLLDVGLFDETLICNEDTDLSYRITQSGKKIISSRNAIVYHPSRQKSMKEILRLFYRGEDNRIRVYEQMFNNDNSSTENLIFGKTRMLLPILKNRYFGKVTFVVLIPLFASINQWKFYLLKHPFQIPKFIIMLFAYGVYCLRSVVINKRK